MDKIEMILQAREYQYEYPQTDLTEFFQFVKDKLELEETKKFMMKF